MSNKHSRQGGNGNQLSLKRIPDLRMMLVMMVVITSKLLNLLFYLMVLMVNTVFLGIFIRLMHLFPRVDLLLASLYQRLRIRPMTPSRNRVVQTPTVTSEAYDGDFLHQYLSFFLIKLKESANSAFIFCLTQIIQMDIHTVGKFDDRLRQIRRKPKRFF